MYTDVFPWCLYCPLYEVCYVADQINFIEEDCRFGVANAYYVQEILKSYFQISNLKEL
jgi:hypothetical protein